MDGTGLGRGESILCETVEGDEDSNQFAVGDVGGLIATRSFETCREVWVVDDTGTTDYVFECGGVERSICKDEYVVSVEGLEELEGMES